MFQNRNDSPSIKTLVCYLSSIIGLVFFSFFPTIVNAGLGVSPGKVIVDDVRPGTEIQKKIYFSRSDASEEQVLSIAFSGPAAESLSGSSQLILPAGNNNVPYNLTISGGTLAAGTYEAFLIGTERVIQDELTTDGGAQSIVSLGAKATITFTVTNNEVQDYSIKEVIMKASEEQQVLGFSYYLVNSGNVDARPSKIELSITDQSDSTFIYNETISGNNLAPVRAFTEKEVLLPTKANLDAGRYWVDITFYNNDEILYSRNQLALQIFPPGTLNQSGELKEFNLDKSEYDSNELINFNGTFENTGDIGVLAQFIVDLSQTSLTGTKRVDILKSKEVFVPPRKTASFSIETSLSSGGDYSATGHVSYGIFESNKIKANFSVNSFNVIIVVLVLLVIVICSLILAVFIKNRRYSSLDQSRLKSDSNMQDINKSIPNNNQVSNNSHSTELEENDYQQE